MIGATVERAPGGSLLLAYELEMSRPTPVENEATPPSIEMLTASSTLQAEPGVGLVAGGFAMQVQEEGGARESTTLILIRVREVAADKAPE